MEGGLCAGGWSASQKQTGFDMKECDTILFAEDDENDALFFQMALSKAGISIPIVRVTNGEEALHYLKGTGAYSDRVRYPFPCLLVTDLKMPRLSGFDLLAAIAPILESERLPVIVLSASIAESDKKRCLQLGAQGYFSKSSGFDGLVALAGELKKSWLASVSQPP
jgi:CheY-like chemotaxis protein